ncbi:hypothetical protein K470DRAFT_256719 [Piedraia hortae CBS 480.64]|uniref:Uncharacterized protein n=1 Tax=Piedraia hortae CBS 480.64 TaxID=1314780 RepID=A0A6A7C1Z0_9PEZI|nr:hypothetical protein K470DRAFT_256719 [Piedraia hortae CBS 480.64]
MHRPRDSREARSSSWVHSFGLITCCIQTGCVDPTAVSLEPFSLPVFVLALKKPTTLVGCKKIFVAMETGNIPLAPRDLKTLLPNLAQDWKLLKAVIED